jgi:hypothetical protein
MLSSMSWSFTSKGSKEEVVTMAKEYSPPYQEGTAERASIERARAMIIAETEAAPGTEIQVNAYGSFSTSNGVEMAHSCSVLVSSASPPA